MAALTGTPNQIELAEQIRPLVEAEFRRVETALEGARETPRRLAVLAILEEKRAEVMAHQSAGYFIGAWRELNDQVRLLVTSDPRYPAK